MAAVEELDKSSKPAGVIDGLAALGRKVVNPRAIVNRKELQSEITEQWELHGGTEKFRPELLRILRGALDKGGAELERRFMESNDGAAAVRADAFLVDQVLRVLYEATVERVYPGGNRTAGEQLALVAVGGYGRAEMAPYSDVDILFLYPYKQTPWVEQVVEYMLYILWDLRLKLGQATRSIDETMRQAKDDVTICTALLESRFVWGDQALYQEFRERFRAEVVTEKGIGFIEAKLQESQQRHDRLGDSRYVVEPNIKEGKGGLRDLQTLFWIGKYLYEVDNVEELVNKGILNRSEARKFATAQKLLWTIRCHMHYLAGRAEERLTFDLQGEIAARMGYKDHAGTKPVERLMKHYHLAARDIGDLTRIFCAAIEAEHQRKPRLSLPSWLQRKRTIEGFRLDKDRLTVPNDDMFQTDPVNLIRLFHVAHHYDLDIHPHALRLATQSIKLINDAFRKDAEANRLFLDIISSDKNPERILRRMNEARVFGKFVTDFGRIVGQMQYDMYHSYTVDEHTIIALGNLHQIERGDLKEIAPVASDVIHKVLSRRALFVATFLHDVAKGRGGDHSVLGERVAKRLCPRFGMSEEETETVAWLVRAHLIMSNTAFKRDLNDPKTIEDFANQVQSPERLRLLLVLTVADIRAVGPNVWNAWKAGLIRELYYRADEVLSGQAAVDVQTNRIAARQHALRARLADWSDEDFEAHISRGYPPYWLAFDEEILARHAELARKADRDEDGLTVDYRVDEARDATEVTIYAADHPGLFYRFAGALSARGANIVDARIFTLRNGMALDVFWVQDERRQAISSRAKLARMTAAIKRALSGEIRLEDEIREKSANPSRRSKAYKTPPRVLIDNNASVSHTVVEVNTKDSPGLLYRVTRCLAGLNLQIQSAKISTFGERVVDVFYVKDLFGLKIENQRRLDQIRETLLEAVSPASKPKTGKDK